MVRHMIEKTRTKVEKSRKRQRKPKINVDEERILQKAQIYLLFEAKRPMFWTVAGIREERSHDGTRRWIIAVHLRYPTGHEGYLGDLVYDGTRIAELTDLALMRERAKQIADDPERERKWHEYQASTLQPRKR